MSLLLMFLLLALLLYMTRAFDVTCGITSYKSAVIVRDEKEYDICTRFSIEGKLHENGTFEMLPGITRNLVEPIISSGKEIYFSIKDFPPGYFMESVIRAESWNETFKNVESFLRTWYMAGLVLNIQTQFKSKLSIFKVVEEIKTLLSRDQKIGLLFVDSGGFNDVGQYANQNISAYGEIVEFIGLLDTAVTVFESERYFLQEVDKNIIKNLWLDTKQYWIKKQFDISKFQIVLLTTGVNITKDPITQDYLSRSLVTIADSCRLRNLTRQVRKCFSPVVKEDIPPSTIYYEDEQSIFTRTIHAKESGFGGIFITSIDEEDSTATCGTKYLMLNAIKYGLIKSTTVSCENLKELCNKGDINVQVIKFESPLTLGLHNLSSIGTVAYLACGETIECQRDGKWEGISESCFNYTAPMLNSTLSGLNREDLFGNNSLTYVLGSVGMSLIICFFIALVYAIRTKKRLAMISLKQLQKVDDTHANRHPYETTDFVVDDYDYEVVEEEGVYAQVHCSEYVVPGDPEYDDNIQFDESQYDDIAV